mmetsp:Transcript_30267/g.48169  ORF Transcript_30267/g.48169 Transcript_30267/m.48169 type:complete len:84 (-) Transcript_30267:2710-2961(-)
MQFSAYASLTLQPRSQNETQTTELVPMTDHRIRDVWGSLEDWNWKHVQTSGDQLKYVIQKFFVHMEKNVKHRSCSETLKRDYP